MSPRPHHSTEEVAAKRAAILESAVDQIAKRGPESVRMKDVAVGAEVSVGTVQYYFGSREELLVQAFSVHSESVIAAIAGLSESQGGAWERLESTFTAVPSVEHYERRSQVWVELVAAARRNVFLQASVEEVFAHWRSHFEALITLGIADGSFRPQADVSLIVDTIIAQIDGFDLALVSGRDSGGPERIARSLQLTAGSLLGIDATVS